MKKTIFSLLLVLAIMLSILPVSYAAEASGVCGDDAVWNLAADGTLTISGTGQITEGTWSEHKDSITRVVIEEGITSTNYGAFGNYASIEEISLPSTMTEIRGGSFYGTSIREAVIPEGVTTIGDGAFAHCPELTAVQLPSTLKLTSSGAFSNNPKLATIIAPPMPNYEWFDGFMFENCPSLKDLSQYRNGAIGINMFANCSGFTELTIPDSVTEIGYCAFRECANLTKVIMPRNLDSIGFSVFDNCPMLSEIIFTGSAPGSIADYPPFDTITATCYYPAGDTSWTSDVMAKFGGSITWLPYETFSDVTIRDWFADEVIWAVSNGITQGVGSGQFAPGDTCTRNQVVTFLHRAVDTPAPSGDANPFTDVEGSDYFYNAVLWAVENKITQGESATLFGSENPCTRAQVVTFLYRAAGSPGHENEANPFVDVTSSEYYYDAVLWAVEKGITLGADATHFEPDATCTRAQIVTFLYRYMNN